MPMISAANLFVSSNRIRLLLMATPIVIGSGVYLYYYYFSDRKSNRSEESLPNIKLMTKDQAFQKAEELKRNGNEMFRLRKYEEALQCYSQAIEMCPEEKRVELATFYQNRAACHEILKNVDQIIADCTEALKHNKTYSKALVRRGRAYETLNKSDEAVFDLYLATMLTQFQNSDYMKLFFEVLDKMSIEKAKEVMSSKQNLTFQKYLFRHLLRKYSRDPLKKRKNEILANYDQIIAGLLSNDCDHDSLSIDDQLLKGTLELHTGKHEAGVENLQKIVDADCDNDYKVNALVKIAELHLQRNRLEEAEKCLQDAKKIEQANEDIYYIISQLHLINKRFEESIEVLGEAIRLAPDFVCAIGQKLFIEFQQFLAFNDTPNVNRILREFEKLIEKYNHSNELILLFFQILISQNDVRKAEAYIEKAIKNDPEDPTILVYRALIYIEEGHLDKTKDYLDQALKIDPRCSFAYEMLAELCNKLDNTDDALHYLDTAINSSTTFEDVKNLISKRKSLWLQREALAFIAT